MTCIEYMKATKSVDNCIYHPRPKISSEDLVVQVLGSNSITVNLYSMVSLIGHAIRPYSHRRHLPFLEPSPSASPDCCPIISDKGKAGNTNVT